MRQQGTLASWDDERGFGFIEPKNGGSRVFMHISSFPKGYGRPQLGQQLRYGLERDDRGRERAARLALVGAKPPRQRVKPSTSSHSTNQPHRRRRSSGKISLIVFWPIPVLIGVFAWLASSQPLDARLVLLYLGASAICASFYALDKSAARKNKQRIPENTLLFLGLIGGWPGGLVASQWLRHKTQKMEFRIPFWFTVLANLGALVFYGHAF